MVQESNSATRPLNGPLKQPLLSDRLDRFGIGLAGLCALHCLATIVLVSMLGVGGHFLLAPAIHSVGLVLALIVAAFAIGWGALRHNSDVPTIAASAGLAFMTIALIVPHGSDELLFTLIGVGLVSIGHFFNLWASHTRKV